MSTNRPAPLPAARRHPSTAGALGGIRAVVLASAIIAGLYLGPDMDCHLRLLVRPGAPLRLDRRQPPRLRWSGGLHLAAGSSLQRIDTRLRFKEMP